MVDKRRVLLTVSGTIPPDLDEAVDRGQRPRADYRVLARRMDADVVDVVVARAASGIVGRLLGRVSGPGPMLAWYAFRRRREYDVLVSDGEQVGLPFALLNRLSMRQRIRHVMIVHVVSTRTKRRVLRWARLGSRIDRYVVYSSAQSRFLTSEIGVDDERIVLTPFMVDTRFFDASAVDVPPRLMVCSAGLERRDYETLIDAVGGLDVDVVIAAASPWSTQRDSISSRTMPPNVLIERLDLRSLRDLYAASRLVVMPLREVDFQAGITTILEAMSMGKAVVCTRTSGQHDTIVDGVTGVYVEPSDSEGLARAIHQLLQSPDRAREIGDAARAWVVENADVEIYADRLTEVVGSLMGSR